MRYFTAIVHHDEGSAYGLTFPDLPGAFAASDDWAGISAAATEALDLWFEDQPDVAPASLDDIRARADVAEELAAGAVICPCLTSPPIMRWSVSTSRWSAACCAPSMKPPRPAA